MTPTQRRHFLRAAAAAMTASPWLGQAADSATTAPATNEGMQNLPAHWTGKEQIGMLLYPGMTALDFVGPQHMFSSLMGAQVHHIAKTMAPVTSDANLTLLPTTTLTRAPRDLDILFVPGGGDGTLAAMQDAAVLAFLADRGGRAKWVTSVCTGSLILGAAGLLKGYRATSHWATRGVLSDAGAIESEGRVVRDRNRITGAGVSAGLDLGLTLVGLLRDQSYAETVQLLAEYAPEPPYNAGSPHTASPAVRAMTEAMFPQFNRKARAALIARKEGRRRS
ncbi:DJ-1/PfpI family protein [Roseateles sp. SL47]|uniref:DJ-1/PfpI family protein n=1 Tax=Roseateles sp. SL47 TaxID=2995138 RepID=UPI00226FAFA2|nr:DJ-1/PfpI family protein [Roseateles sp. SL47]WAC73453.1 DJ-1/PfpI family protein [Roseateles sp. SL47]